MTTRNPIHKAGVAVLALAAFAVPATTASAAERPIGPRLQAIMDRAVKAPKSDIPGVAFYVKAPGRRAWSGAAGKANIASGTAMRAGDRFRAGSILKTFVAAATLQLAEAGRFGLDDSITSVLPPRVTGRFTDADRITVRMLLNHTSGIGEFNDERFERTVIGDPLRRWRTAEFLDRGAAQPRTGEPGEHFSYSNTNYTLLGLVIEQATGRPWRAIVRERVIARAHLRHTTLPEPGTRPAAGRGIAHGYQVVDGRLRDLTAIDSSVAGAAGGHALLTTTEDLARFLRAVLDGRLFEHAETVRQMRTFVPTPDENGRIEYGLALERFVLPGGVEMIGHMGTTGGYRAFMFHLPARNVDFAMVTNSPVDPMPVLGPALRALTT